MVYQCPGVTTTKYHKLRCSNNRNLSHSSGGRKSTVKVSLALVPPETYEGDSGPGPSPRFWRSAGRLWPSLA